jgi:excisionase family DNA binding protein
MEGRMIPDLLTVKELAKKLNMPQVSLYKLVENDLIPNIRIGKSIRFVPQAINAWLLSNQKGPELTT